MKYFYTLTFFLILLSQFSEAQSNFKPGYLLDLKGDTIKGFVDYREWEKNPKSFSFKKENGTAKVYNPQMVQGFAVYDYEYFERHVMPISQDRVEVNKLSIGNKDTVITDTVFLKVLTKGKRLSLYAYTDPVKTRFYIAEPDSNIQELVYKVYYDTTANDLIRTNYRYRTQLLYVAQKNNVASDKLSNKIERAYYGEDDVLNIVQAINGTTNQAFTPKGHFGTRWFAGLGASYNKIHIEGQNGPFLDGTTASSIAPTAAFGIDLFTNKNTQRLFLRGEISLRKVHYNFPDQSIETSNGTITSGVRASLDFKQTTISVRPQVIYNIYAKDNFKTFLGGGVMFNFSTYNNYAYKISYYGIRNETKNHYPELAKQWPGFILTAGTTLYKRFEINLGCSLPNSFADDGFSLPYSSYQVGVNYLF